MVENVLLMNVPSYGIQYISSAIKCEENIQEFQLLLKTWAGKPCII